MKYCHLGLFTSLPFLYEIDGPIRSFHWKSTMHGNIMARGQPDMWLFKGLDYYIPQEIMDNQKAKRKLVEQNVVSTELTYVPLREMDPSE